MEDKEKIIHDATENHEVEYKLDVPIGHPLYGTTVHVLNHEDSIVSLLGNLNNEMQSFCACSTDTEVQLDCVNEALAYAAQMTYNLEQLQKKLQHKLTNDPVKLC